MILRVDKVRSGSELNPGAIFRLTQRTSTLGRDPRADIVLADPRISRRHCRLELSDEGLVVENLSRHPIYVNKVELASEGVQTLTSGDFLQVGGVLLQLFEEETLPADGPMSLHGGSNPADLRPALAGLPSGTTALLTIDFVQQKAQLLGRALALRPLAFAALCVLARHPGQWVPTDDFLEEMWPDDLTAIPSYVSKQVSYVRKALAELASEEPRIREALRTSAAACADGFTELDQLEEEHDTRTLLREVIASRRKVGFRLLVSPDQVHWVDP